MKRCPQCETDVSPKANGQCPACGAVAFEVTAQPPTMSEAPPKEERKVRVRIVEKEKPKPEKRCPHCNAVTEGEPARICPECGWRNGVVCPTCGMLRKYSDAELGRTMDEQLLVCFPCRQFMDAEGNAKDLLRREQQEAVGRLIAEMKAYDGKSMSPARKENVASILLMGLAIMIWGRLHPAVAAAKDANEEFISPEAARAKILRDRFLNAKKLQHHLEMEADPAYAQSVRARLLRAHYEHSERIATIFGAALIILGAVALLTVMTIRALD